LGKVKKNCFLTMTLRNVTEKGKVLQKEGFEITQKWNLPEPKTFHVHSKQCKTGKFGEESNIGGESVPYSIGLAITKDRKVWKLKTGTQQAEWGMGSNNGLWGKRKIMKVGKGGLLKRGERELGKVQG